MILKIFSYLLNIDGIRKIKREKVKGGEYMACVNLTEKQMKILEEAGEKAELIEDIKTRLEKKGVITRADYCTSCC